jgi:large subunit ribosomal protein L4
VATLKKYNLSGKNTGEVSLEDALLVEKANPQMIKDYLVALRANARQWSASTQTRAEVSHSKKKPYNQKGSGNARQGFLGSPQFRGGGRVHAPRPKFDQHVRINKKERQLTVRYFLSQRIKGDQVSVLENHQLETPKTKPFSEFLKALELSGKRVLFLVGKNHQGDKNFPLSLRNIPKVEFAHLSNISGYDLALNQHLIIADSAIDELKEALGGKK